MDNKAITSVFVGMFIMCFALFVFFVVMKKLSKVSTKNKGSKYTKVIDRLIISKDKYIEIIEVGDSILVLGISPSSIELLHKAKKEEFELLEEEIKYDTFKDVFTKIFNKTKKNNEDEINNEETSL